MQSVEFLRATYPCSVEHEGIVYPSVFHAMQAAQFTSPELKHEIANSPVERVVDLVNNQPLTYWDKLEYRGDMHELLYKLTFDKLRTDQFCRFAFANLNRSDLNRLHSKGFSVMEEIIITSIWDFYDFLYSEPNYIIDGNYNELPS